ncbi:hypothetical protein ACKI1J_20280 [Streptomyces scabiei]|uniref:SCO2400 family protein n=1 Tax=Streptomyces scabiei TaxID=1930 RepID=UPI0038F691F9
MDYCSSCRRHLNGALVCPGCGAYAPDIAPAAIDSRVAPVSPSTGSVTVPAVTWDYGAADGGAQGAPVEGFPTDAVTPGTGDAHAGADADADVDLEGVPEPPRGRAARRRQLARWKKNQRRAVVATTVALVGGGLTVLGMDRQSTDRTQAATAPDAESLGALEEQGSQRGRTPETGTGTETDDARRTADAPTRWTPSGDTSRDRSAANRSGSRASRPDAPRTAPATPSAERARTGAAGTGGTATDTPADGATTPPATDDPGSSADTGTGSGADTGTGADTGNGGDTGSANGDGNGSGTGGGNGTGTGTGAADGSGSDTATTSPSGLCLLGIVCVD